MRELPRAKYGAEALAAAPGKLPTPYPRTIGPNAMRYLREVVEGGLGGKPSMVARFEAAFAAALGVKHCIATPGCNPALSALAAAFSLEPGDEVIVSPITDYGSIQGILKEHYIPVFADTEPGTVNLSAATIERRITDRTRAILVVHKTGIIGDMDPILDLARRSGLVVYEDACQAIFSRYKGRFAGTTGVAAGFSFDSEKTMGSDIGGCLVTNDDELAERIRFIGQSRGGVIERGFGRKHVEAGYAFRMTQCTAAMCLAQLEIVHDQVAQRDRMVRLLSRRVAEIRGIRPLAIPDYLDYLNVQPRVRDVGDARMFFAARRDAAVDPDDIVSLTQPFELEEEPARILIAGYEEVARLSEPEWEALPLVIRSIWAQIRLRGSRKVPRERKVQFILHRFFEVVDWLDRTGAAFFHRLRQS